MRIERITLTDYPPIKNIDIQISANLVIVAGANGSGKTRLKEAIIYPFATAHESQISLLLRSTTPDEESILGQEYLEINQGKISTTLRNYLQTRTGKNAFSGSIIQIESNRTVRPVQFQSITSSTPDPDEQGLDHSLYLDNLSNRWNRLVNNLYAKSAIRNDQLARFIKENPDKTGSDAAKAIPDPLEPFQKTFSNLFPDKKLEPIDIRFLREFEYRDKNSQPLSFGTLSSGERELVTMVFDLIYKEISHSIIIIDEPELHLHPALTFRFIETLKGLCNGTNQIILFTHSADLISTYYTNGNVFVLDPSSTNENQVHILNALNESHSTIANALSENLGIFAVGKNIVFVEGENSSIDRLIYGKVAQSGFSYFQIVPIGSVENIITLRSVINELRSTIFGVRLFLIRDRDGLSDKTISTLEENSCFRCLPRRHIENYLLDAEILRDVAISIGMDAEKTSATNIERILQNIASQSLMSGVLWNVREYIRLQGSLSSPKINKGEINQIPPEKLAETITLQLTSSFEELSDKFNSEAILKLTLEEYNKLQESLSSNEWKKYLPGKTIFNRFCSDYFHEKPERIQEIYTNLALQKKPQVFQDISKIFQSFSELES
ncbi:MAG TPA: AAA family ATPase [Anaerolineales bacterium]|nr:AAA family ATPase [Anaerolineales bacterium]HNM37031.1 AAA family ATPase [Anaerolineales bacterium]